MTDLIAELDALYKKRGAPLPRAPSKRAGDNGDPCICGARNTWHPECYTTNLQKLTDLLIESWPQLRDMARDAERYRWLRNAGVYSGKGGSAFSLWLFNRPTDLTGRLLDESLDAAMQGGDKSALPGKETSK